MKSPHPQGLNPCSAARNECLQGSQPPCAQDTVFHSAFNTNSPAPLAPEYFTSLRGWAAHQKRFKLEEEKRQLAGQLYRTVQVENLRAAALRKMYMEEEEWSQQQHQHQQQQSARFNRFSYHPAEFADNSTLDARYEEPMPASIHTTRPPPFVYRDDTFANGREQVDVEEALIDKQAPEECYSNEQKQQDDVQDRTSHVSSSESTKTWAVEKMNGLAAYVAGLKAQMAEKMNSGDFMMDASTAHGYEQYSRTPAFFRARRNERCQERLSSAGDSQADQISEGSMEQIPNPSTPSGDSRTPDLYDDSQDQSESSVNSLECSPDEPIFRSPDGPPLEILSPQPTPPRSAILQMTCDEIAKENYLYHGYGVDAMGALHWQLPDWVWHHKSQQGEVVDGIPYNFYYPPGGHEGREQLTGTNKDIFGWPTPNNSHITSYRNVYLATPEFVEVHHAVEQDYPAPAEYRHEMSTFTEPLADPHELLRARIYGIPPVDKRGRILPPSDILEPSIFEPFIYEPAAGHGIIGEEAKRGGPLKPADLSLTVCENPLHPTPQRQEPGHPESLSSSVTPPNRFRHPVDSDPVTPESPVFEKSTLPIPAQFDVHNANTEHFFTPSPHKPGSSPRRFIIHTRKSIQNKNRGEMEKQEIEAIKARRAAVDAYLGLPPSGLPIVLKWRTPEPETPPSSPYPYSVDTPSPSVLVHQRHLKMRRAKIFAENQSSMPAGTYKQGNYPNAQRCWN